MDCDVSPLQRRQLSWDSSGRDNLRHFENRIAIHLGFESLPSKFVIITDPSYTGPSGNATHTFIFRSTTTHIGKLSISAFIGVFFTALFIAFLPLAMPFWGERVAKGGRKKQTERRSTEAETPQQNILKEGLQHIYSLKSRKETLPSFAEEIHRPVDGDVTQEEVRQCLKRLREMYRLNVYVSNLRYVRAAAVETVREKERQAAAALAEIKGTLEDWKQSGTQWSPEEQEIVEEIYTRIMALNPVPLAPTADANLARARKTT